MTLTHRGSRYVVLINREQAGTPRPEFYEVVQDTMVRTFRAQAGGAPVREASRSISTRSGADVVEVELELARPGAIESTTFIGLVPIEGGAYGIIVSGPKDERADVRELYETVLDSMRVTPPALEEHADPEADPRMKDPAYRAGYRIGESLGWVYTVAWWLTSIIAGLVIGIRGHRIWRAIPDGQPATSARSTGFAGRTEQGPVVNPFKRTDAKSGDLPPNFFGGYDEKR